MSWLLIAGIYALCWWVVLFATLPLWVNTPEEPEAGHEPGAPEKPMLGRKMLITTLVSAVITAAIVVGSDYVSFRP